MRTYVLMSPSNEGFPRGSVNYLLLACKPVTIYFTPFHHISDEKRETVTGNKVIPSRQFIAVEELWENKGTVNFRKKQILLIFRRIKQSRLILARIPHGIPLVDIVKLFHSKAAGTTPSPTGRIINPKYI